MDLKINCRCICKLLYKVIQLKYKKNSTSYLYWKSLMLLTSYLTSTKLISENLSPSYYLSSNTFWCYYYLIDHFTFFRLEIIIVLFLSFFFSYSISPLSDYSTHQSLHNLESWRLGSKREILLQTWFSLYLYNKWADFYKLSCTRKLQIRAICIYMRCTKATTNN